MAPPVKALTAEPGDLSSVPGTHLAEGENTPDFRREGHGAQAHKLKCAILKV